MRMMRCAESTGSRRSKQRRLQPRRLFLSQRLHRAGARYYRRRSGEIGGPLRRYGGGGARRVRAQVTGGGHAILVAPRFDLLCGVEFFL